MPKRTETRIDADQSGITIGIDSGSFSAAISTSGILSLGIGIAEVNLNLKNPNESEINYAFGLYSIEGEQQGCTVILRYYIGEQLVQTETRTIPECDNKPEPEPEPEPEPNDEFDPRNILPPKPPKRPYGNPYDTVSWVISGLSKSYYFESSWYGSNEAYGETYVSNIELQGDRHYTYDHGTKGMSTSIRYSRSPTTEATPIDWRVKVSHFSESASYMNSDVYKDSWGGSFYWPAHGVFGLRWECEEHLNFLVDGDEKREQKNYRNTSYSGKPEPWGEGEYVYTITRVDSKTYKVEKEVVKESTFPPIHNQPAPYKEKKMDDNCCDKINEIYEVLGIEEMQDKGFIIPNRMIAPNAKGNTKLENYLQILEWQIRQADHLGIHPFVATIKDANEAIAGDQSLSIQYPNATAALKYIAETAMEGKGDAAVRLSLLVRLSYASAQITTILVQASRGIKALSSYFGMPLIERIESVKIPFDILLGTQSKGGNGFGKETTKSGEQVKAELLKKIDQNSEDATEDMLPDFMKVADLPVKTQDFKPSIESDFWAFLKRVMRID